jgi:hypothetical protein
MASSYGNFIWQLFIQFSMVSFLVVAVAGLGAGAGLIISSQKTVEFFHLLNRWVSTRHVLKSVEVPRDMDQAAHRYQRWLAAGFVLGGLVSIFGLAVGLDASAVSAALAQKRVVPVVAVAVESAKWFLIVGSAFGIVVGVMLIFYPNAESTMEKYANRWVSSRQVVRSWDDMHMTLDRLVEAHPKPAGWIIACTSAAGVIFGLIVLTRYY